MKKYSKFLIIIFLGLSIVSCEEDFLSPDPTSAILLNEFYTNEQEIELGIIGIYDAIQGVNDFQLDENRGVQLEFFVTEMLSDNTSSKSPNPDNSADTRQFDNYTVTANNGISANYYASMFRVVYLSNLIIDSTNRYINDEAVALKLKAEAKFLRAYAYFNLIRLYGEDDKDLGLPYVDHVLTDEELETQYTRVSEDEIYNLIISDLILATESLDDTYKTRASKSAAHTLLAKVYLSLDDPIYGNAIAHLDQVYGNYTLLDSYSDIFDYNNELNDEVIFAIGYEANLVNDSQNFSLEFTPNGNASGMNMLTDNLVTDLSDNGGSNRQVYSSFTDASNLRYQTEKFSTTTGTEPEYAGFDWIVLRYADVILMYAEAYMQEFDSVTLLSPWNTDYNKLRTRAGLSEVTSGIVTKEELLAERRYEFFTENKRLFDLKRFDMADAVLGQFAASSGYNFDVRESGLPIPLREINLSPQAADGSPLLVQNSFWD